MQIPTDFVQDSNGDAVFPLRRTSGIVPFVVQKLRANFNFWKGEWFANLNEGLPMFEFILGQPYDPDLIQAIFTDAALKTQGIDSVASLATAFDSRTRTLTVSPLGVIAVDGTEVPDPGAFVIGARN